MAQAAQQQPRPSTPHQHLLQSHILHIIAPQRPCCALLLNTSRLCLRDHPTQPVQPLLLAWPPRLLQQAVVHNEQPPQRQLAACYAAVDTPAATCCCSSPPAARPATAPRHLLLLLLHGSLVRRIVSCCCCCCCCCTTRYCAAPSAAAGGVTALPFFCSKMEPWQRVAVSSHRMSTTSDSLRGG
jgi:hypothetical protein